MAVIAGDELAQGVVKIKDMAKSEEYTIARADVAAEIKKMLG